jgi:hypothetical protein
MVMWLVAEDIYIDIKFLSWTNYAAGGGFSYIRSVYIPTESEFLASLVGTDGTNGADGTNGVDGTNGADGINTFVYQTPSIVGPLPQYTGNVLDYATIITLTAPSDGLYWLSLHTETYGASNGSMYPDVMAGCRVEKNGSGVASTSNISQHDIGKALTLVAGDVIVLKCSSNAGGGYANNSHGYIQKIQ